MKLSPVCLTVLLCCLLAQVLIAQPSQPPLSATILQKDSLFWQAYNTCTIENTRPFLSEDVEFYHDKGGITKGRDALMASLKQNLCGNADYRLRREAVAGTVEVFPLQKGNTVYGAIIAGEHQFYIGGATKREQLDGRAKFTHLWLLRDGNWQMARILSYDHHPAVYVSKHVAIQLPGATLDRYVPTYRGPNAGLIRIRRNAETLVLTTDKQQINLYPESETVFFTKERDLTVSFVNGQAGQVTRLVVRENGAIVEEAVAVR